MSLPGCQQRILDGIAGRLQARDPRFASLFSIFTRLTRQEPMPSREELEPGLRRALRWLRSRRLRQRGGRGPRRASPSARLRAIALIPVALAAIIGLLALSPLAASPRLCGPAPALHPAVQQFGHARVCGTARAQMAPYNRR